MTSIMRRTVRGTAAGLGALAIVAGTAACGGLLPGGEDGDGETGVEEGGEDPGAEDPAEDPDAEEGGDGSTEEDPAAEEGGDGSTEEDPAGGDSAEDPADEEGGDDSAQEDPAADEEGEDAAAGEALTEGDLTAAGDVFFEFLQAAATSDGEAACALVTNPINDEPLEGSVLEECAKSFEQSAGEEEIDPAVADMMDRSMIEAIDNGDGTAGIELMGEDYNVTLVEVTDGQWYLDGGQFL